MPVFTVPEIGVSGPQGAGGPASPAQVYGGVSIQGFFGSGNPSQALVTGFQKVVNFSNNMPSSGVTPQFALNQLTIVTTGDYLVYVNISWQFGVTGNMRVVVFVNGGIRLAVLSGAKLFGFAPSQADAANFLPLVAGDVVDLRVGPSVAGTMLVDSAQIYVERADP